jgi:hypothetical protein
VLCRCKIERDFRYMLMSARSYGINTHISSTGKER